MACLVAYVGGGSGHDSIISRGFREYNNSYPAQDNSRQYVKQQVVSVCDILPSTLLMYCTLIFWTYKNTNCGI